MAEEVGFEPTRAVFGLKGLAIPRNGPAMRLLPFSALYQEIRLRTCTSELLTTKTSP